MVRNKVKKINMIEKVSIIITFGRFRKGIAFINDVVVI